MLTGPTAACRKALAKAGMDPKDIDLFEINEAFAVVPMQTARNLGVELDRVNVNGGAIAMGHPLGATGCIILGTLLDELERRNLSTGLATLVRRRRHGHRHHHRTSLSTIMSNAVNLEVGDDGILVATMDVPGRPMNVVGDGLMAGIQAAVEKLADPAVKGLDPHQRQGRLLRRRRPRQHEQVDDARGAVQRLDGDEDRAAQDGAAGQAGGGRHQRPRARRRAGARARVPRAFRHRRPAAQDRPARGQARPACPVAAARSACRGCWASSRACSCAPRATTWRPPRPSRWACWPTPPPTRPT